MERAEQPVAGPVAGEDAAGAVGAVCGRRQADERGRRRRGSPKPGTGAPVGLVAVAPRRVGGDAPRARRRAAGSAGRGGPRLRGCSAPCRGGLRSMLDDPVPEWRAGPNHPRPELTRRQRGFLWRSLSPVDPERSGSPPVGDERQDDDARAVGSRAAPTTPASCDGALALELDDGRRRQPRSPPSCVARSVTAGETFLAQEQEHADTLTKAITQLGGDAVGRAAAGRLREG